MIQLEFDLETSEINKIKIQIDNTYNRVENVRKGIFKKHSLLSSEINNLKEEINLLKQQMNVLKEFSNY